MNVLIVNLTRFGDLLQTQPVASGLAARGHRVGLLCLDNFASAAPLLADVDWVHSFPGARLLAALDRDWREAVARFDDLRREVAEGFAPQRIINLTPSLSARLLARALAGDSGPDGVRGFSVDEFGFNADSSSWAAFLQLASANRGASPFNVVDVFRRVAGLRHEGATFRLVLPEATSADGEDAATKADSLLSDALSQGVELSGWLGVQLGASEERRRWPVAHFAGAARLFADRRGLVPVLLGTAAESRLGDRFQEVYDGPVVNLIGKTSLPLLGGVLSRLDLLLTNDTGTMHFAAGLGVPVAAVFLATAQPFDTGPYAEGGLCFEPDLPCHPCPFGRACAHEERCRSAVPPETVFEHAAGLPEPESHGARVWRTVRAEDGFMDLESLSGHDRQDRTRWIALQRRLYRRLFDDLALADGAEPHGLAPETAQRLARVAENARDLLFLLEQQGQVLAARPLPAMQSKFLATWQRLQGVLQADPDFGLLGDLWEFESQRQGERLDRLVSLASRFREVFEWMRSELER